MDGDGMSEYEKYRVRRISENKAKLEALGLSHISSSLVGASEKLHPISGNLKNRKIRRGFGASDSEDEDYRPSDDDECSEGDDKEESSMDMDEDEENARVISPFLKKGNKWSSNVRKKGLSESDFNENDTDLMQAIALSLEATNGDLAGTSVGVSQEIAANIRDDTQGKKVKEKTEESAGRKKDRKLNKARVQLTEDEIVAHFFSFDETGKGYITLRDVKKKIITHDFSWTDIEIEQMIYAFDSDGDGKLSLEDFWTIISKCKMI